MSKNDIMKIKGFEFNRDVETKFGILPMHTLVTFREATDFERNNQGDVSMDVRTYISCFAAPNGYYGCCVDVDLNNEEELLEVANDFVTRNQEQEVEVVAVMMYIKNEPDFWFMIEHLGLTEPDMSEYYQQKQEYHDSVWGCTDADEGDDEEDMEFMDENEYLTTDNKLSVNGSYIQCGCKYEMSVCIDDDHNVPIFVIATVEKADDSSLHTPMKVHFSVGLRGNTTKMLDLGYRRPEGLTVDNVHTPDGYNIFNKTVECVLNQNLLFAIRELLHSMTVKEYHEFMESIGHIVISGNPSGLSIECV